jgi:hypothetical protein
MKAEDWQLMLARAALRAGNTAAFTDASRRLLDGPDRPSADTMKGAFDLAQETLDLRKLPDAQALYEALARQASGNALRAALSGLGRVHDLKGDPHAAADAYLRSALLAATADANAVQARLLAATNLVRAGLKNDARTQFEWVIKHSKDQTLTDEARRALARL